MLARPAGAGRYSVLLEDEVADSPIRTKHLAQTLSFSEIRVSANKNDLTVHGFNIGTSESFESF